MTWRRLGVLLRALPVDSEYKTELRNTIDLSNLPEQRADDFGPWSQSDMLLARIGDLINHSLWMQADPDKRSSAPPAPYPRPGVKHADNVRAISPEALAYLEYKRQHQGADPPDDWKPELT